MTTKVSENGPAIQPTSGSETNTKQAHADMSSIIGNSPNFMENASKLGNRSTSIKESIEELSQKGNVQESSNTNMNVDERIQLCVGNDINVASAMANAANRNGPIMGNFVSFANAKKFLGDTFALISDALSDLEKIAENDQIKDKNPEQKLLSSITGMLGRYIPGESIGSLSDNDPKNFIKREGEKREGEKKSHKLCSIKNEIDDMLKGKNGPCTVGECIKKIRILMNGEEKTPGLISILDEQKPAESSKASDQPNEVNTTKDSAKKTETEGTAQNIAIQRTQDFQMIQILCGTNDLAQTLKEISIKAKDEKIKKFASDLLKNLNETGLKIDAQLAAVSELRKNDFFYEYSWQDFDESITDVLVSFFPEGEREIVKKLVEMDLLASRKATGSADSIKSGMRGRTVAEDISKRIADRDRPEENFYCLSYDDGSDSNKKALEKRFTETTKALIEAMQKNKAFAHSFRPKQFANGNMIDSKRLGIINDPIGYINELLHVFNGFTGTTFDEIPQCVETLSKSCTGDEDLLEIFKKIVDKQKEISDKPKGKERSSAEQDLAKQYLSAVNIFKEKYIEPQKFFDELPIKSIDPLLIRQKILNHTISKGKGKNIATLVEKDSNGQYKGKSNLAAPIQNTGLRAFCSVSGTTTDIVAVLWVIDRENTEKALRQLNTFIKTDCQDFSKLGNEFKNLFLSIALYMQSGQYHSAAEVLSGLCCSAQTLIEHKATIKIQNGKPEPYSTLMEAFKDDPSKFFPKGDE